MPSEKYYVVWSGREIGIFNTWEECKKQVEGFSQAKYKSFSNITEAQQAFQEGYNSFKKQSLTTSINKHIVDELQDGICVDGAWNTKTLDIEYQGVMLKSKELVFKEGPFRNGTNNIAEFLGIVYALEWCQKYQKDYVIYSDSQVAINWIKQRTIRTGLKKNESTMEIFLLINNALQVLHNQVFSNFIIKWETGLWGENPADFGRK